MTSQAQIDANRTNAQHSTGPKDTQKSSMNAVKHHFTAQKVFVPADQQPVYENHTREYRERYNPQTHEELDLIQQFSDQHWTLHQISIQEMNVLTMMNLVTENHMKAGSEPEVLTAATAPFYKQLSTISMYESRRRRAAKATMAKFEQLKAAREETLAQAAVISKAMKMQGKQFNPAAFGFVCTTAQIDLYQARQQFKADMLNFIKANKS